MEIKNKYIIIYDGYCNLCSSIVFFIKKKDSKRRFVFIPFQSDKTDKLMKGKSFSNPGNDTVILLQKEKVYERTKAIIEIFRELGGIWKIFIVFLVVPPLLRDKLYNFIARNRYRWFGTRINDKVINDRKK